MALTDDFPTISDEDFMQVAPSSMSDVGFARKSTPVIVHPPRFSPYSTPFSEPATNTVQTASSPVGRVYVREPILKSYPVAFTSSAPYGVSTGEWNNMSQEEDKDEDFLHDVRKAFCKALPTILVTVVSVTLSLMFNLPIRPLPTNVR